jgi:hypothetical protein
MLHLYSKHRGYFILFTFKKDMAEYIIYLLYLYSTGKGGGKWRWKRVLYIHYNYIVESHI